MEQLRENMFDIMVHTQENRPVAEYYFHWFGHNLKIINSAKGPYFLFNTQTALWENLDQFSLGWRICTTLILDVQVHMDEIKKKIAQTPDNEQNVLKIKNLQNEHTIHHQLLMKLYKRGFVQAIAECVCCMKQEPEFANIMDNAPGTKHLLPMPVPITEVLNLKTGELEPRTSEMYFTKTIKIMYEKRVYDLEFFKEKYPEEEAKKYHEIYTNAYNEMKKAIEQIFMDELIFIDYVKKIFGLLLTGETKEKIIIVFYGPLTNNGKSFLLKLFSKVLGPFCAEIADGVVLECGKSSANAHTSHMSSLLGLRLAKYTEIPDNAKLASKPLKQLSGDDSVYNRDPFGKTGGDILTPAKLILCLNKQPNIPNGDEALWKRLRYIKFMRRFIDNPTAPTDIKCNKDMISVWPENEAYLHAFLHFCLQGAIEYYRDGIQCVPLDYLTIKDELREASDVYQCFVLDLVQWYPADQQQKIQSSVLFEAFKTWLRFKYGESRRPPRQETFNEQILNSGHDYNVYRKQEKGCWFFYNMNLKQVNNK